jgi:hypothetical protein
MPHPSRGRFDVRGPAGQVEGPFRCDGDFTLPSRPRQGSRPGQVSCLRRQVCSCWIRLSGAAPEAPDIQRPITE